MWGRGTKLRWAMALSSLALVVGCAVSGAPQPSPKPGPPTTDAYGWRYINLTSLPTPAQLRGVVPEGTHVRLVVGYNVAHGNALDTVYKSAPFSVSSGTLIAPFRQDPSPPSGYQGPFHLKFGNAPFANVPVPVTLVSGQHTLPLPKAIPAYQSMITPESEVPGSYDTTILGQSGGWLWLALTDPAKPAFPSLIWGFRSWSRLVAMNVQTGQHIVYRIPPSTNPMSTFGIPPAFATANGVVWIANQDWLGRFPADPLKSQSSPVLTEPPHGVVVQRQSAMLRALTALCNQAADGLAGYWDHTVMRSPIVIPTDHGPSGSIPWIMDPIITNHSAYPDNMYWAARFPLTPGSSAYEHRALLMRQIFQMARNPICSAIVVYPSPSQIRAYFHSQPPAPLPGYHIQDGLYVPVRAK